MKLQEKSTVLLSASMVVLFVISPRVLAGPDLPLQSGLDFYFTGNQSSGIWPESYWASPPLFAANDGDGTFTYNVYNLNSNMTPAAGVHGIRLDALGANGANGANSGLFDLSAGGNGGDGGSGSWVVFMLALPPWKHLGPEVSFASGGYEIITSGTQAHGIYAASIGGNGGNGGSDDAWVDAVGGDGGDGGYGWDVIVNSNGGIHTGGDFSPGIYAVSQGGNGGNGGSAESGGYAEGGKGGQGRSGGPVSVHNYGSIETAGNSADGIVGKSLGGAGGSGGYGGGAVGVGGGALGSGPGGNVVVGNTGDILTSGVDSRGILAQSVGGFASGGGGAGGVFGWGGSGNSAGDGGDVTVTNSGTITTEGDSLELTRAAIFGQSIGGGGGNASGSGGVVVLGGGGSAGGNGGNVAVGNSGQLQTWGIDIYGILAQSIGGGGGSSGGSGGLVSIGGSANSTGDGGTVTVVNDGAIHTQGGGSDSIFAQTIGGGGGTAGSTGGLVAIGGAGSAGGDGGTVNITNRGVLQTGGNDAIGIDAQSIGKGGGSGAGAGGLVAIGGSGSGTSHGGVITIDNSGAITTAGTNSASISAQSIGGGGGRARMGGGLFSLGGSGAGGGNGGTVNVTNSGLLQTADDDSFGIVAQSVGAGGGSGGGSGGLVAMGGSGDSTGNGGSVTVQNSGAITTAGNRSDSIFAQSIGGGGGVAGGRGGTSYSPLVSMGGRGGAGGSGDVVRVNNSGDLETSGGNSSGILAQSVGGGGGAGGAAYDVGLGFAYALGGGSTGGGDGGQVDVDSANASILTAGVSSHGIHAQSVGGGGGSGGNAYTVAVGVEFSETAALGGWAGAGGNAAAVNITSGSTITTQGAQAHGLYAESVGGGGGSGGDAVTLSATIGGVEGLPGVGIGFSLGGWGGDGGNGQAATITSTGNIATSGSRSYGAHAQSVGGGGGDGGISVSGGLSFKSMVANMAMGGFGGYGGAANKAFVDSAGSIDTQGDSAYGILAQSVGGGGGAGGNSVALTIALPGLQDMVQQLIVPKMSPRSTIGGSGGSGGVGGEAEVTNKGPITTQGSLAHGILAQSIGGGGGAGGDDMSLGFSVIPNPAELLEVARSVFLDGGLKMGASGGSGGSGGIVTVDNSGDIATQEDFATGILAQSVGGGGGVGGLSIKDKYGLIQLASSLKLERSSGGNGSGAAVNVNNSGDITTHGGFAHGILAQSIGGGGGFAGIKDDVGVSTLVDSLVAAGVSVDGSLGFGVGFAGSAGGSGSAGAVSVTHTGSITTHGDTAHGILAQSAAGSGTAGPVTVTLASDITANGVNSDGIHAQSVGGSGRGNISVNIGGGTVRGGSGSGAGVNIDGGANNTLTNAGSVSALSGTAIIGGIGNDTVHNNGIITGSVNLGTGSNVFNNNPAGVFNSGAIVNLGGGNAFTNAGVFSPGGLGTALNTTLIGDLIQSPSGLFEIEIGGFTPGSFDFIDITGTLTGELDPLGLPLPTGNVNFSFLSGYDIASEIAPGQTMTLQFWNAGYLGSFAPTLSYGFLGSPSGFQFNVFQQNNGLYFQAVHPIPAPSAFLLGCIGLGVLGWARRRVRL